MRFTLRSTDAFDRWVEALRDARAKAAIARRLARLTDANPGDVKALGAGVMEMRIDFGPGYRIYYARKGAVVLVLLCGGDKSSQPKDIVAAKSLAALWTDLGDDT